MTVYKQYLNKNIAEMKKEKENNAQLKEKINALEEEAMFKHMRATKHVN